MLTGTLNSRAIRRYPNPRALASSTAPINPTPYCRRNKHKSGNNTCVPAQHPHLARRGTNTAGSPHRKRTDRARANPHGPKTPAHDGHDNDPPRSSDSTSATTTPTINIGCHLRHPEGPPDATVKARREGPHASQDTRSLPPRATYMPTLSANTRPHPEIDQRSTPRCFRICCRVVSGCATYLPVAAEDVLATSPTSWYVTCVPEAST